MDIDAFGWTSEDLRDAVGGWRCGMCVAVWNAVCENMRIGGAMSEVLSRYLAFGGVGCGFVQMGPVGKRWTELCGIIVKQNQQ